MDSCIFCNIVEKKLPAYCIYEDDEFYGFMDIFPRVVGHCLLVPKKHYRWVYDVPSFGAYWEIAKKLAQKVQTRVGADYVGFVTVGEEVHHAHIHILPQMHGKMPGINFNQPISQTKEQLANLANSIISL